MLKLWLFDSADTESRHVLCDITLLRMGHWLELLTLAVEHVAEHDCEWSMID